MRRYAVTRSERKVHLVGGTDPAKAHDFGLDDFSDEPLWNDEIDGNN